MKSDLDLMHGGTCPNCCAMIYSENWLDDNTPDEAIEAGRTIYSAGRTHHSGKKSGGVLCIYINNYWCTNSVLITAVPIWSIYWINAELFSLPREFSVVYLMAIYIPPQANTQLEQIQLHDIINKQLSVNPDWVFLVAGDFNQANLKTVLPKFSRNVRCPTTIS